MRYLRISDLGSHSLGFSLHSSLDAKPFGDALSKTYLCDLRLNVPDTPNYSLIPATDFKSSCPRPRSIADARGFTPRRAITFVDLTPEVPSDSTRSASTDRVASMAEEDAEIALLHQMQAGQENMAWGDGAEGHEEDLLRSNTENSDQQVKEENFSDDQDLRALSPSVTGVSPDDDTYDPLSPPPVPAAVLTSAQIDSRSSSRASTRKPRTIGGFLADDSDEDDLEMPTNISHIPSPTNVHLQPQTGDGLGRAVSRSPLHISSTPQEQNSTQIINVPLTVPVASAAATASINHGDQHATQNAPIQESIPLPSSANVAVGLNVPKARLPLDRVGILEDRIKEDPRGDTDAWLSLISEHRKRNKTEDARGVYERFFKVFPSAADIWVAYAEMELSNDNFYVAEQIFAKSLLSVPNVQLWSVYLNYIRRRNDLTNDPTGQARSTISMAYEFVLENIGIDRDSGRIWQEYIQFIRSAPGQIGGSSWQDQQKMDQMRKAYQRAICVPMSNVGALWKEYDQFERSLNQTTGRKFLQDKSPAYMTARSANTALENITHGLIRSNLPRLPPALGFDGDQHYLQQVELWRKWISWEQEDPLVLRDEDVKAYKDRVLYAYKQALMALRFWPEMWVEAAEWCFANSMQKDGVDLGMEFLTQGISANPESCLLAFKHADRLETTLPIEEGEGGLANRGAAIREPYDRLQDALYDLIKKLKVRETREIARIEESASLDATITSVIEKVEEDDEEVDLIDKVAKETAKADQLRAVQQGYAVQKQLLSRTISFSWIALMRAMRRVQGKGKIGALVGGSRQIFNDARTKGQITSDVYVASALIEHHVYKDPAGTKIFERGAKLFPEDEVFIVEYLKHLLSIGDTTNARAAFETSVNRLSQKPEQMAKAKPLYVFFHKYESEYGELSQIRKLEQRMADLFPDDPRLLRFGSRYTQDNFDPTNIRPIISPATQMRPKAIMQSIEQPSSVQNSPRPQYRQENSPRPQYRQEASPRPTYLHANNSPKRPLAEESGNESDRPRKLARGESPLKGAAGRRLDQQKRMQHTQGTPVWQSNGPSTIPRDVTVLLSIIPGAETYTATRFNPEAMVRLLAQTPIPEYSAWKSSREQPAWRR